MESNHQTRDTDKGHAQSSDKTHGREGDKQQARDQNNNRDGNSNANTNAGSGENIENRANGGGTMVESAQRAVGETVQQASQMARDLGGQALSTAGGTAQDLTRRAGAATDAIYEQGARAGEYLSRNMTEYPMAGLLIAGMIGYMTAFLIHSRWQSPWGAEPERQQQGNQQQGNRRR